MSNLQSIYWSVVAVEDKLAFFANVSSKTFPDGSGIYHRACNHCPAEFYIHAFPHGEILGCVQYEQHEGN